MTIIDFMRQKLTEYPKISEFLAGDDIHIDFTEPDPMCYGLSSTGDSLVKEDLLGNQTRRHNFSMYAVGQSFTDYNRLANSNFLLELGEQKNIPVQPKKYPGGTNDTRPISKVRSGVRVAAISSPTRYIHTAACAVRKSDYESMVRLVSAAVRNL